MNADDEGGGGDGRDSDGRGADTDALLMEAAYHTLCEHGYAGFSLRKVAAEAGKSRGLVHYHFDSKDDLLASLLEYLVGAFEARFEPGSGESSIDRLDALLSWVAFGPEVAGRDGEAYFTALFELRAHAPYDDAIRARLTRNFVTIRDRCAEVIEAGIDDGELRRVDPNRTATFLVTAVDGARNAELTLDVDEAVAATLDSIERFVFEAMTVE